MRKRHKTLQERNTTTPKPKTRKSSETAKPNGRVVVSCESASAEAQPPPLSEFDYTGHPWIGLRVLRRFGGDAHSSRETTIGGRVFAWLPARGTDQALWKIVHDDMDVEDLEDYEALDALNAHAAFLSAESKQCEARLRELRATDATKMTSRGQQEYLGQIAQAENDSGAASAALELFTNRVAAGQCIRRENAGEARCLSQLLGPSTAQKFGRLIARSEAFLPRVESSTADNSVVKSFLMKLWNDVDRFE